MGGSEVQRRPHIGVMIEVPAAVELAAELAAEVDFLSIGTNDLIQYTLVVDREDSRMSSPRDAYHPAILRMLRRTVDQVHSAGKEVSVCGEMAARPDLARHFSSRSGSTRSASAPVRFPSSSRRSPAST